MLHTKARPLSQLAPYILHLDLGLSAVSECPPAARRAAATSRPARPPKAALRLNSHSTRKTIRQAKPADCQHQAITARSPLCRDVPPKAWMVESCRGRRVESESSQAGWREGWCEECMLTSGHFDLLW